MGYLFRRKPRRKRWRFEYRVEKKRKKRANALFFFKLIGRAGRRRESEPKLCADPYGRANLRYAQSPSRFAKGSIPKTIAKKKKRANALIFFKLIGRAERRRESEPKLCADLYGKANLRYAQSPSRFAKGSIPKTIAKKKKRANALFFFLEQMTGIEPACLAWEASALPLSYICIYGETALTVRRQSGLFIHRGLVGDYAIALSLRVKALFLCAAAFLCMMPRAAAWSTFFTAKV